MKMWILLISGFLSLSFMDGGIPQDQLDETDTEATVLANYLFHVSKYSNWPDEYKKGDFVLGIVGHDELYEELVSKYANKPIGSQLLQIKKVSPGENTGKMHVLFVSGTKSDQVRAFSKTIGSSPTLLASFQNGGMDLGSIFNFVVVDNVIRFEINDTKARNNQISLGSRLKSWAIGMK